MTPFLIGIDLGTTNSAVAFVDTRRAGALLIIGLVLNALLPIHLPWV